MNLNLKDYEIIPCNREEYVKLINEGSDDYLFLILKKKMESVKVIKSKKKSKSPSTSELILKMGHDLASFRQEFNSFRNDITNRLNYIVKANKLKDLPKEN